MEKTKRIEKELAKKGINTSSTGAYFRPFKEYIDFPSFDVFIDDGSKYTQEQFDVIRGLVYKDTTVALAINNLKDAVNYLNKQGFNEYSWPGFLDYKQGYGKNKRVASIKQDIEAGLINFQSYRDNIVKFWELQHFFYDKAGIFWLWNYNTKCYGMVDEVEIIDNFDHHFNFYGATVPSTYKNNYLEALKRVGRWRIPKNQPKYWIQFKDKVFDVKKKEVIEAKESFFFCNPIPWELGETDETPVMDKLFQEWVGKAYTQTLYEIIAYCCLPDYPMHLMFCLIGSGRNGKSQFQRVIQNFIGNSNICSTELDLLIDNRFESAKLFKRLVCTLGETNFGVMKKTSLLKKLSGGDMIGFEFKNKTPFDDYNYAKIIINSNSLPSSLDTSDGFYRRWFIIDFPNEFPEGKDVVVTIPEQEYKNLARKIVNILPNLLHIGKFTNQGSIEERRKAYIMASNPLPFFLSQFCERANDAFIKHTDLYNAYTEYLVIKRKRKVSRKEFSDMLAEEGLFSRKTTIEMENGYFIEGVSLKMDWKV